MSPNESDGVVIFLGNVPFRSCWQRPQQLARGLARSVPVLYVDPNRSFLKDWFRRSTSLESLPRESRLQVFEPPAGLPLGRSFSLINRFNCSRTFAGLRRFLQRIGTPNIRAVIASFPDQWELVRWLPDVPVLYDVMDDFTLFLRPGQGAHFQELHEQLLARASFVLTSARVLEARHRRLGTKAVYLGNGVWTDLVERCALSFPDPALSALPRPRLGYVGMISRWLDFSVVRALAEAFPGGAVVLAGPRDVRVPALPRNVHVLDAVPQKRLPGILRSFDVGLIPFIPCPAIDAVNPVKLYEYLAAGLPVLASNFAEMRVHAGMASRYRDPASAVLAVRQLLEQGASAHQIHCRQRYALENSWEERTRQLHELIQCAEHGGQCGLLAV